MTVQKRNSDDITVLVVDDQPEVRALVRLVLKRAGGFDIIGEASTGAEAIKMVGTHVPDVVVLDISMPVLSGIDAIKPIRSSSPGTQVVMFSSADDPDIPATV